MKKKVKAFQIVITIACFFLLIFCLDLFADGEAAAMPLLIFYALLILSVGILLS